MAYALFETPAICAREGRWSSDVSAIFGPSIDPHTFRSD